MTMRTTMAAMALLLGFMFWATEAQCSFIDGNKLFESCMGKSEADVSFCNGYVAGAFDNEDRYFVRNDCVPEDARLGQLVDIVTSWLKDHPEKRHLKASEVVTDAIKERFPPPCHPEPRPHE
jgi:Rap1a immunity proteins